MIYPHRGANRRSRNVARALLGACLAGAATAHAQQATTLDQQEQRDRAQRGAEAREARQAAPDARLGGARHADFKRSDLPVEANCFHIGRVELVGEHAGAFAFAQRYLDGYAGRCIGRTGIDLIVRRTSDLILDRGYVTTRIGVAPQDLAKGTLTMTLVAGTIARVRYADGTPSGDWRTALPSRPGDLLNLRDIEQALEQMKRVPSQDVSIDIAPGEQPGQSDLVVTVKRARPWHVVASLDDSGSRATGRLQAGLNLGIDNPLALNDVLSLGYNHDVYHSVGHGTQGQSGSYSLPWGKWLFTLASYGYRYHQTVEGSAQTFLSSGTSRTTDLTAQRMLYRDATSKTSVEMRVGKRWAHSYVEDTEIDSQRRDVSTAEIALLRRQFLGPAQLDLRLAERYGVHWFGGQRDTAGHQANQPTLGYALTTFDATLGMPFTIGKVPVQWTSELHGQRSGDTLYGSEFITIGGRYTVRGFDGEQTLAAERGWYWRNSFGVPLGHWPVQVYAGFDGGHIGGPSAIVDTDKTLRGQFVGLRGSLGRLSWDAFAGWASHGQRTLDTMRPATGFQLIYQY
jgi:hemolysin activation/secretion protein